MNILSKIILTLISISIFVFLIFVTYITNSFSSVEKIKYTNTKLGLFELNKDEENIFSLNETSNTNSGTTFVKQINTSDKIIFSDGNIEIDTASGNTIISIIPGVYFFDLKEINTPYIIKGLGFEINNKGPGMFIINNLDPKKNIIFSLNSLLDLNLKNSKTNENITTIDLYPHIYLIFDPKYNIFLKNADLLNVSQKNELRYFNEQIISGTNNDIISDIFLDLVTLKGEKYKELIKSSLLLIKQEYQEETKNINNFIDSNIGTIPGENFINKYSSLFINPNKKSLYYKNIIIKNLHELLTNDKLNNNTINIIIDNYILLEEVDTKGAEEIKNIINYYYAAVIKSNKNINTNLNFSELLNKINNKNLKFKLKSLISLEKVFFKYDFLNNNSFYNEIANFGHQYFDDLNVDIKGDSNKASISDIEKVDYMLFFLENILLTSEFYSLNIDSDNIIEIFNNYVEIANSFYSFSDDKIKRTGLFTNSKILNKFIKILEEKYFDENRNENSLLKIKKDVIVIKDDILLLEKNINEIFDFYEDHKIELKEENNKDKFVIKLYFTLNNKYKEYFSALKNYEEYLITYDKSKKDLLSINTINENNDTLVLSLINAKNYLEKFNGIQLNNIIITLMDYNYCLNPSVENELLSLEVPYCYKIENLNIDGNNISFLLHPFEKNKIDEIIVNNQIKSGAYKLDEVKLFLDEKIKTETKDKDKYDFKNFLVDTFGQKSIPKNNNVQVDNSKNDGLEEDPVIKIFKRNKLLGEIGDFANLGGFLDINYKDLIVEKVGNEYAINIILGILNVDLGKNDTYYGYFSSEYNFSPNHSFIDPKIKLLDKKTKKDLLLGNYIYIIGQYKVNSIKEEIKEVFYLYNEINYIVNTISQTLRETEIKITYNKDFNQISFEIPYKGEIFYLTLDNGNIIKAEHNKINKLEAITPYTNLSTILNNITK